MQISYTLFLENLVPKFTRTKVICTMGPSVNNLDVMVQLIEAGMSVARLNFSHGSHAEHLVTINLLRQAREKTGQPLSIMMDTKGPEIRIGHIKGGSISVEKGHQLNLLAVNTEGDDRHFSVNPGCVLEVVDPGTQILFDDGYVSARVVEVFKEGCRIEFENAGVIRSGKGVNIPGRSLNLPAMTEQDIEDIRFGCRNNLDYLAASFIRSSEHVIAIKKLIGIDCKSKMRVLAKIENREGIENFDSIVQVSDGIMIARGDLGVEVPLSEVPRLQKMMIRRCYLAGKPSITATQMLESMIQNPRPTRAEASDVANAIYDSTSLVMLSGETAVGKYPVEAVKMMKSIIAESEADFDYKTFFQQHAKLHYHDVPSSVTLASVKTAYSSNAKAIFCFTSGGYTARKLSRLRPSMPIVAATHNEKSYHQLAFNWGVIPEICEVSDSVEDAFIVVGAMALEQGYVKYGDLIVMTAGSPFGVSGTTNTMIVDNIGNVAVRGSSGYGNSVTAAVHTLLTPEHCPLEDCRGKILLIIKCNESYNAHIEVAAGVIMQNNLEDIESQHYLIALAAKDHKSVVCGVEGAFSMLQDGQVVAMDPSRAVIYRENEQIEKPEEKPVKSL